MSEAYFRFYAELGELLSPPRRARSLVHAFEVATVKDAIEALGVPHTEVDFILVNSEPAAFSCLLRDGDRISVYPVFRSLKLSPLTPLPPQSASETRFVLDTHLGRLAAYLRMLGFDSLYRRGCLDEEIAHISANQHRTLLSRDRGLLKRSIVTHGYLVREANPVQQLMEVVRRFDLPDFMAPFRRCLHCNTLLRSVAKDLVNDRLPPKTRQHYDEFHICPQCNRVYWKGSHYRRMKALIKGCFSQSTDLRD
ncbi:MAG TPA: Mut7-C RNAse domain-containing protein [Terriglobales bacterium]|nr:Mut7-C RNAse domain-containing protein [Terriglobales bacterium]